MDELYNTLVSLGPKWANIVVAANIIGLAVFVLANRKYQKAIREAHDEQVATLRSNHAEQIALKEETIKMIKGVKDDAEKERNMYRDKLHEEKAHHQATLNRLTEAESRPNYTTIAQEQQKFFTSLIDVVGKMDERLEQGLKANTNICDQSTKMMAGLVEYLQRAGVLPKDNQQSVVITR